VICNGAPGELTAARRTLCAGRGSAVPSLEEIFWRAWREILKPQPLSEPLKCVHLLLRLFGNLAEEPLGLFWSCSDRFVRPGGFVFLRSAGGRVLQLTAAQRWCLLRGDVRGFQLRGKRCASVVSNSLSRCRCGPLLGQLPDPAWCGGHPPLAIWPGISFPSAPERWLSAGLLHALLGCGPVTFQAASLVPAHYPKSFVAALFWRSPFSSDWRSCSFGNHDACERS